MRILIPIIIAILLPALSAADPIVINAVGDIMLAGSGSAFLERAGFDYPFRGTAHLLGEGDLNIGNLESPIAYSGEEYTEKTYRFRSDPAAAQALKRAGFNHLSLANNHILDFGPVALEETISALEKAGISHAGAGPDLSTARKGSVVSIKGIRVALLAYSMTFPAEFYAGAERPGTAPGYENYFRGDIARARKAADYVIVSFHWGRECSEFPKDYQKRAAHRAIDAGADVVLGHHPHVLQGIEFYNDGVIFYSLGNFAFASSSRKSDRSVIARITLDRGIRSVEIVPLNVLYSDVRFQPRILTGHAGSLVADRLNRLSAGMGTLVSAMGDRYLAEKRTREVASR